MPFELPALSYSFDALTMEIHHDRHHKAYIDNVNAALAGTEWADTPVEDLLRNLSALPADKQGPVRNNAGGHANHTLFWEVLGANGGSPTGDLGAAVASAFGSFDELKAAMVDAGIKRFGSGWSWLVVDGGKLAVMSTPNQDSPLSEGKTPIFGIDVWEHAYYLNYQNKRPAYLEAIWNVVNWDNVAAKFDAAM